ncbi:Uu.00g071030.m01.CDS01 [Anthostomella pinea]|uniref:Uu.00g071030.m01.CDS01 n=1 Tax=Anthostomella pinea TaxID=933095 RepID=A0AAI8YNP6_9PEZI|nr:Uu.00g071030.m01.CDS01 [Anthostomella pinea]
MARPNTDTMLCDACVAIFEIDDPEEATSAQGLPHHATVDSFYEAVARGCFLCRRLDRVFKEGHGHSTQIPVGIGTGTGTGPATVYSTGKQWDRSRVRLALNPNNTALSVHTSVAADLTEVNPNVSFNHPAHGRRDLIRRFYSNCDSGVGSHKVCKASRVMASERSPSHTLIDLRRDDDKDLISFRFQQSTPSLPYCTFACSCADEHSTWLAQLPRSSDSWTSSRALPACIQDAARLATAAGVWRLWLRELMPSRALAQHDPDLLCDIYGTAAFNIVSLAPAASTGGCIPPPRTGDLVPVIAPTPTRPVTVMHDCTSLREPIIRSSLWADPCFHQSLLASPATLFCTAEQLWWQCHAGLHSETYPEGAPPLIETAYVLDPKLFANFDRRIGLGQDITLPSDARYDFFAGSLAALWTSVVSAYSQTTMTSADYDRWVGIIDAMARHLIKNSRGPDGTAETVKYAHGTWSARLVEQLAWKVADHDESAQLPCRTSTAGGRPPTWSWLSAARPVQFSFIVSFLHGASTSVMRPDDHRVAPIASAEFVEESEGGHDDRKIRIRGRLIEATVDLGSKSETTASNNCQVMIRGLGLAHLYLDDVGEKVHRELGGDRSFYVVPLFANFHDPSQTLLVQGILVAAERNGLYTRCGWAEYNNAQTRAKISSDMADLARGNEEHHQVFLVT